MHKCIQYSIVLKALGGRVPPEPTAQRPNRRNDMATATVTRPSTTPRAAETTPATPEPTARDKAVAALVIGSASALTVGVFAWAVWVASQIAIPV